MNKQGEEAGIDFGNPLDQWCRKHHKPYGLPNGAALIVATIKMVDNVLKKDDFARRCGGDPDRGVLADADRITEQLRKVRPLCCYLGDKVMAQIRLEVAAEMRKRGRS